MHPFARDIDEPMPAGTTFWSARKVEGIKKSQEEAKEDWMAPTMITTNIRVRRSASATTVVNEGS
jgi:hypothetical protein